MTNYTKYLTKTGKLRLNFIGLGKMGNTICNNLLDNIDYSLLGYDPYTTQDVKIETTTNLLDFTKEPSIIFSSLPNDTIVENIFINDSLAGNKASPLASLLKPNSIHISLSTISPKLAKSLSKIHEEYSSHFISAPIFARPDGLAKKEAYIPITGDITIVSLIKPILEKTSTKVIYFGKEAEKANIVKLCGNFLICSAIESMSEAFNLAESYDIDRTEIHKMLSESIFDCLIYKGYGHRVSNHDHKPYENAHFALDLGHKDMILTKDAAKDANIKMPVLDILDEKFKKAKKKNFNKLDWSAISLI
jgi:3-hydroxyisobutyrate dehydrogenase-like beta-hydroxyacid dehydrogenase